MASGGHSSSRCAGLSLLRPLLLRSTGSRCTGSVVVAHGPSCSAACGIFPDQGSNPCPLHWQADSQPLCHQGSPPSWFIQGDRIQSLVLYSRTLLFIHSKCNSLHLLTPNSQSVPLPPPLPFGNHKSVLSTTEYYSAIKKSEIMPFAATWMDLEIIILSEVSQKEKDKYHITSLTCGI